MAKELTLRKSWMIAVSVVLYAWVLWNGNKLIQILDSTQVRGATASIWEKAASHVVKMF